MANFDIAYNLTKRSEGGYANVEGDNGQLTYAGITKKNFPGWAGWATVLSKPRKHNEHIPELSESVKAFYKKEFWDKIQGDTIANQDLANDMFDMAVNASTKAAIKIAQDTFGIEKTGVLCENTLGYLQGLV